MKVNEKELERALKAALIGPDIKGVSFVDETDFKFNVKPIERKPPPPLVKSKFLVEGQISHRIAALPDDQFFYSAELVKNGPGDVEVDNPKMSIDPGGLKKLVEELKKIWDVVGPLVSFLLKAAGVLSRSPVIDENLLKEAKEKVASTMPLNGTWQSEVQYLAVIVLLYEAAQFASHD